MLQRYIQRKWARPVLQGLIVLDKEAKITSHDEVDRLRQIYKTRKVGHSGTLDPKVTGILVCGIGKGTKVLEYVLLGAKTYEAQIEFHKKLEQADFENVLVQFRGTIEQMPPHKSRVKRARREREVYKLELLDFAPNGRSARFRARVERGTYIRTLCHNMGQVLGVGAHMGTLRRIQAGPYSLSHTPTYTTKQLQKWRRYTSYPLVGLWYSYRLARAIRPIEDLTSQLPQIIIADELASIIASGSPLYAPGVIASDSYNAGDTLCISTEQGRAIAIARASQSSIERRDMDRGIVAVMDKVLIDI
ncbi:MAG: RNA-guided pseudouridylation complex pseudouridine synthase subunit Cbf5 [Patescibacteria group bacterium]